MQPIMQQINLFLVAGKFAGRRARSNTYSPKRLICSVMYGLDSARKQGRTGGRPKALTDDNAETIRALRQSGKMSVKKICETMKVTRSVFYRCINE